MTTNPTPDYTSPLAGRIEVREPCPWCADRPMVPRSLMDDHCARLHPDVQVQAAASAVVAVAAPPTGQTAELRQRIIGALLDARRPGLGGMTEADAVAYMADAVLRRLADEAQQQPETEAGDTAQLTKVARWVTSEPVTANTEFGNGYRACQRDIRDLLKGRFDYDPRPAATSAVPPQPEETA